ncbi:MAG: MFS transporter [Armatimonadetes bacterium]|nr:MFS transporter [Armatimonadota bacterium]
MRLTVERKWLVLLAVGAGTFMTALDTSVVNTTLPLIRQSLHVAFDQSQWVVTVYLLGLSGLLLSFGRLGDLHGHKRVFTWGFGLFVLSSLACAASPGLVWLVTARGLQAVGGAMITSNAPALLTQHFPPAERGRALGLQATMTYLGLTCGPSLGGWLATSYGWRSIFYVNLPIGIVAVVIALLCVPTDRPSGEREPYDPMGSTLFLLAMVLLLWGLNQAHRLGWGSPAIVGTLCMSVVIAALFVRAERTNPHPMLDLSLFGEPVFSSSVASAVCNYICVYSIVFLVPHYLINVRHMTAAQAGLILTAQPLIMAVVAPLSGHWSDHRGTRLPSAVGMVLLTAALASLAFVGMATPGWSVALRTALAGLGTGIFISPNNSALLGSAPRHRQGIASGVLATSRNGGMVLGVGLAGAVVTTAMAHGMTEVRAVGCAFGVAAAAGALGAVLSVVRAEPRRPV